MAMTIKDLAALDEKALANYIRGRLQGKTHDPPYYPDRMVEPESFLVEAYQGSTEQFRQDFAGAVIRLLRETKITKAQGDYLSRLLYLIEKLELARAQSILRELWRERAKFKNIKSYYTVPDLYVQLIAAVTQFKVKDDLLPDLAPLLKDPRYAPAAYTGILEMDLETAIQCLPEYILTARKAGSLIWIHRALQFLADQNGAGDAKKGAKKVWRCFEKNEQAFGELAPVVREIAGKVPEFQPFVRKRSSNQLFDYPLICSSLWTLSEAEKKAA